MIPPRGHTTFRPGDFSHSREHQPEMPGVKKFLIGLGVATLATLAVVVPQLDTNNTVPDDKIDVTHDK
jgi:hypothetical protein